MFDLVVVGAGPSGVFAALEAKRLNPSLRVAIFERSNTTLSKVKISGGGRCNVTHNAFEIDKLCSSYPRGTKELIGVFHRFNPKDTIAWFCERGVELKVEKDGRMFPITNRSATIVEALMGELESLGVELFLQKKIQSIESGFKIKCSDGLFETKSLVLATGSNKKGFDLAKDLGHTIVDPIASLFTFNVPNSSLKHLSGVSVESASVKLEGFLRQETGPLLITHFGFSGPAIIKLSAFAAKHLHEKEYRCKLQINWMGDATEDEIFCALQEGKLNLPKSLLRELYAPHNPKERLSHKVIRRVAQRIIKDTYDIDGKTTHKEEFVTCGGVSLKEINFKTMESKIVPNLYIVGELLDVDGVTGGFNFQNAWSGAFVAANSLCLK
jgi:predicted Rossmann fold flavoprotein